MIWEDCVFVYVCDVCVLEENKLLKRHLSHWRRNQTPEVRPLQLKGALQASLMIPLPAGQRGRHALSVDDAFTFHVDCWMVCSRELDPDFKGH